MNEPAFPQKYYNEGVDEGGGGAWSSLGLPRYSRELLIAKMAGSGWPRGQSSGLPRERVCEGQDGRLVIAKREKLGIAKMTELRMVKMEESGIAKMAELARGRNVGSTRWQSSGIQR